MKSNPVVLDLANEVAKLQGCLVMSTFRQKSHSSLVLNTEHNGMVHRRVASTCSCEHARARLPLIEAVPFAESLRKLAQSSDLPCRNCPTCPRVPIRARSDFPHVAAGGHMAWPGSEPHRIMIDKLIFEFCIVVVIL